MVSIEQQNTPDERPMSAQAVVFEAPGKLALRDVTMSHPKPGDVVVDVMATGISTGTERLLWEGEMPSFPGMGYPLIPGYETVGRIVKTSQGSNRQIGDLVFIGGAHCFPSFRNLFGGAASQVVVPDAKAQPIEEGLGTDGLLLALAATAYHALHTDANSPIVPDLIIGHGVLGRLMARICVALGYAAPTVWEISSARRQGTFDYRVIDPSQDKYDRYRCVVDVSGDSNVLDTCMASVARREPASAASQIVLAGFYKTPVQFDFAPAFMRELRIQVAAEWQPTDLRAVDQLVREGKLSLGGLITHVMPSQQAAEAYEIAFSDEQCLKMALDWGKNTNV